MHGSHPTIRVSGANAGVCWTECRAGASRLRPIHGCGPQGAGRNWDHAAGELHDSGHKAGSCAGDGIYSAKHRREFFAGERTSQCKGFPRDVANPRSSRATTNGGLFHAGSGAWQTDGRRSSKRLHKVTDNDVGRVSAATFDRGLPQPQSSYAVTYEPIIRYAPIIVPLIL